MSHVSLEHFLVVGVLLFTLGIICVLTRRNVVAVLIGIELILNSASLNFIAFSRYGSGQIEGSIFVLFIIVLAAAEAVVALALLLALQRQLKSVDVTQIDSLKG